MLVLCPLQKREAVRGGGEGEDGREWNEPAGNAVVYDELQKHVRR